MPSNAQAKEFDQLRDTLERLARAVIDQLQTLETAAGNAALPELKAIVARDREIDDLELSLDRLARTFMELRAPLGPDFRFVMAALDMARNLERIGDCCEYVARHLLEVPGLKSEFSAAHKLILAMIGGCREILELAYASWTKSDSRLAGRIPAQDDAVDGMQKEMYELVVEQVRGGTIDVAIGMKAMLMANKLESIGDIASHIAESVVFMLQARQIRHAGHGS